MKIEYRDVRTPVQLKTLIPGDTFIFDVDLQDENIQLYLLTNDGGPSTLTTVNLFTGEIERWSEDTMVDPVNSVVKILEKL